MNINTSRQPWMRHAVCARSDPEEFYPEKGGSTRRAKAMCFTCPATDLCLQWALDNNEQYGVLGGLSARCSPPDHPPSPAGREHRRMTENIYAVMSAAMEEVQAVRKDGFNDSQKYNFRGIDQVVNAVGPIFRKHKIIPVPYACTARYRDVLTSTGKPSREVTVGATYRFYGPAGDFIEATVPGESMDTGDKGTPKAMSVAYRIVLLQMLCIPTDEPDPDSQSYERAMPDPIIAARIAVADAWRANRGELDTDAVAKDFMAWAQGELFGNATSTRLYEYAEHLKQQVPA